MFIIILIVYVDIDARYNATTAIAPANKCKLINFLDCMLDQHHSTGITQKYYSNWNYIKDKAYGF